MLKQAIAIVAVLGLLVIVAGCEETSVATEGPSQHLLSYPYQGEILYGEDLKADLTWGDFGHRYSFQGVAGETVTFVVEWREPESTNQGVDLAILDASYAIVGESVSSTDSKAHVEVTFAEDGTYYVYVGHYYWGWFGRYPYKLGADPHLCAQLSMVWNLPEWEGYEFYGVDNYEVGQDGDPWSYFPDLNEEIVDEFTILERDVKMGPCNAHIDDSCSPTDPVICGGTFVGGGIYDNACAFRTMLHTESSDFTAALGGFTPDLSVCEQ